MNNVPGMVYRGLPDWSVAFIGAEVETMTGYAPEEFLAKRVAWRNLIHPDDLRTVLSVNRNAVRSRTKSLHGKLRIRHRNGEYRWIEDRRQFIYNGTGNLLYVDGLCMDVTEQKEAEEKLREAKARAEEEKAKSDAIIAAMGDGISIQDRDFRILYQNEIHEKLDGKHLGEFCYKAYPALDRVCDNCPLDTAFRLGKVTTVEWSGKVGGQTRHVEITASPLRDAAGKIVAGIEIVRDISERRRSEEERIRLATAVDQSGEMIVITDAAGAIVYVNPAFERITGYTREEVLGRNPRFLNSGRQGEALYREVWETISRGAVWNGRIVNKAKKGNLLEEDVTISPVRDTTGAIVNYVAAKRNITREAALERQVQTAQRMEAVGTLAGGIAHDFNNALTGVIGFSEMLRTRFRDDPAAVSDVNEVMRCAERAAALTRQLLAFARRQVMDPIDLDLNSVVDSLLKLVRKSAGAHIEVIVLHGQDIPAVRADQGQMEQVLMNLCLNARDAMPDGGQLLIETGVVDLDEAYAEQYSYVRPGRYVMLTISDTGVGMDEATREHAFDPFFTTKAPGRGTGLGLSMVYGIVKQHGGFIHLDSEPGKGSVLKIYLPAVQGAGGCARRGDPAIARGGTETILLAEDDESARLLARRVLEAFGYKVLVATDGEEAVAIFRENRGRVDLLLLDVVMPRKGGVQAMEEMRRECPGQRVLFVSGYSADAVQTAFVSRSEIPHLAKPFSPTALAKKVREVLDAPAFREAAAGAVRKPA